jgi:hypothetical protein
MNTDFSLLKLIFAGLLKRGEGCCEGLKGSRPEEEWGKDRRTEGGETVRHESRRGQMQGSARQDTKLGEVKRGSRRGDVTFGETRQDDAESRFGRN